MKTINIDNIDIDLLIKFYEIKKEQKISILLVL